MLLAEPGQALAKMIRAAGKTFLGQAAGIAVLVGSTVAHAGGAWVSPRGLRYVELSSTFHSTDRQYDFDGSSVPFERLGSGGPQATYKDISLHLFAEAGLGRGFGAEGELTWRKVSAEEPATVFRTNGPADARLQLKRGFRAGRIVWALSLEGRFPMGYDTEDYPSLGSGHVDAGANLHLGSGGSRGYAGAEIGVLRRGGQESDEWPFAAQAGLNVVRNLQFIVDARGHGVLGGVPEPTGSDAAFDPKIAVSRVALLGPGIAYTPVPGLRISAAGWRTVSGANAPQGWLWKLAVARIR